MSEENNRDKNLLVLKYLKQSRKGKRTYVREDKIHYLAIFYRDCNPLRELLFFPLSLFFQYSCMIRLNSLMEPPESLSVLIIGAL